MNPNQLLNSILSNSSLMQNPMAKNTLEMYRRGDIDGLKRIAENLCKERGVSVDSVAQNIFGKTK